MENPIKEPGQKKQPQKVVPLLMMEAGFEFAFLIAAPLIAGIFAGKWLDAKTNHHFFVIIGILAGLAITALTIYRRILDYKRMMNDK